MGYLGSRDYPRLKQLLDEGNVIACFVDYNFSDNIKCRDIACAKKLGCGENVEYSVGVRGIGYSSVVLFILDGNHLAAWVVNVVLWCFMLWEMFNAICDKLDAIAMGVHAILFGKVEEVVIAKKADDEPKAEAEQE